MRTVSDDYLAQVQSGARQFGFGVKVYGNAPEPETLLLGDIISVEVTRSISDGLQIGACMSDKLVLQTRATSLFSGRGKKVEVFYRCTAPDTVWSKLGTFYVSECVTEGGVTAVEAYDKMSRLDKRVSWIDTSKATAPTFPCKMQAVLNYLCERAGITTDFVCEDITVENAPDGFTARELISYIAASHGANAHLSPSEVLKIRPYTAVEKTIDRGRCFSLTAGSDECTVNGILFDKGAGTKVYIDGTACEYDADADGIVEVYDPFATIGIAEYAWSQLGGMSYSAVSIEMPAENILEVGDVFTVSLADGNRKTAVVMEQRISASCTGGFVESISCTAESKAQTRNVNNRTEAVEKEASATFPPAPIMYTFKPFTNVDPAAGGGFEFKSSDGTAKFEISENGIQLFRKNAANGYRAYIGADTYLTAYVEDSRRYNAVNVLLSSDSMSVGGSRYSIQSSNGMLYASAKDSEGTLCAQISINGSELVINYGSIYRLYLSDGEFTVKANNSPLLSVTATGLYVNGKKVLTEE